MTDLCLHVEVDGVRRRVGLLQPGGELRGVSPEDAAIVIRGLYQHRRVSGIRLNAMVRRVGVNEGELLRVIGAPIFRYP